MLSGQQKLYGARGYVAISPERRFQSPNARAIMVEGMGTQFDPNMKAVFLGCLDQLEQYYRQHS